MSLRIALLSVSSLLLFSIPAPVFSGEATPADGLRPLALRPLPLGSLEPQGWLQAQLRIQASGLTGHLDEFWPDVQKSGWIGGSSEGWERHPYWLDGFIPLAFLLQDQVLIAKAKRHVDAVLERQQADGWLGPEKSATGNYKPRDPWPVFVMLKALLQYEEATGDPRIVPAMTRYFRVLDDQLSKRPLFEWNRMRWQDGALCVHWLHDRTREPWLLSLAGKQGFDWRKHFEDLPFKAKVAKWEHESHVVNNAMGVKASGVWFRQSGDAGDRAAALVPMESLDRYHGQAAGQFSGDECFAGRMPSQGTETCAVVEYIYSVAVLASILGEPTLGDRLEALGYNSLPAPFKPDMWARQYVQQANQAVVQAIENPIYTTNGKDANVYGLETNYGCCTANMHQGWPKFAAHLWMALPQGGLAALSYAPVKIAYKVNEVPVSVEVQSTYPFEEEVKIAVSVAAPAKFPLWLRVPAWARGATIAVGDAPAAAAAPAAPGGFVPVEREWSGTTAVTLRLPMEIRLERRFEDAVTVHRGPLVFSLKIGEDWKKVAGEVPHADWEVHPTTPWNYALAIDTEHPEKSFEVVRDKVGANPFDPAEAPIRLMAKGRRVPEWKLDRGAAQAPPRSPATSSEPLETITLIPYGAAKLRITEFPVLAK
jgi:hypothetical protein